MKETIDLTLQEVNSNLQSLKGFKFGSDEYSKAVTDTSKLIDKANDMIKLSDDIEEKKQNRTERKKNREEDKAAKESSDKKAFWLDVAKIGAPLLSAGALILHENRLGKSLLYFEKHDILKSTASRNFFSNVLRRKR